MIFIAWDEICISPQTQWEPEFYILEDMYMGITKLDQMCSKYVHIYIIVAQRYTSTFIIVILLNYTDLQNTAW